MDANRTTYLYFFVLTILFTWVFWFTAIATGGLSNTIGLVCYIIGGTGPLSASIILIAFKDGKTGIKQLLSRMVQFRSMSIRWGFIMLAVVFIPIFVTIILGGLFLSNWSPISTMIVYISAPIGVLGSVMFNLIAVIFEEPGWRGFALDKLQEDFSALTSSLILGLIWAIWHTPLFLMPGTYQYELILGSLSFWVYMIGVIPTSILITWLYNNNNSSLFAAMLYHLVNNLGGEIFTMESPLDMIRLVGNFITAIIVIITFGKERLVNEET
ncbi:MAG: CPBP family intramembrane metalloprotease [Candidatus Lokiarchaeota archaeon]|nr:CPBP family intramembrane metalloprotease [Candidatus Lokiarchaeota archaeon]